MVLLVHYATLHIYVLLILLLPTLLITMCFARQKKLPISPLKYDPDDPSTFPPSETDESAVKQRSKPSKDKEKKNKSAEKKAQKSTLNALKSSPFSSRLPPMMNLREANDMETVNDMVSAWGAVQVQEQDPPNKDNKIRSEMQPPK